MNTYRTAAVVVCAGLAWCSVAWADITTTGDIHDDGTWYYVAKTGDGTLTIDAGSSLSRPRNWIGDSAGVRGTVMVTGPGSTWTSTYWLQVGNHGSGALNIEAGGSVNARATGLGGYADGTGRVTVTGSGSTLSTGDTDSYIIGEYGTGRMSVKAGGLVSTNYCWMGFFGGGYGYASVSGDGSTWTNSGALSLGHFGSAKLSVSDGGVVTAKTLGVNSQSRVTLNVSGDDMLVLGDAGTVGSLTNNGRISLWAGAGLPAGVYHPISEFAGRAMAWSGSGAYEAFGGTWNDADKSFEASGVWVGNLRDDVIIRSVSRLSVTDPASGNSVGASFGAVPEGTTFSVDLVEPADLADLDAMIEPEEEVLAAWDLTSNLTGQDVLLTFEVGAGMTDLEFWHLDGGGWSSHSPESYAYDASGDVSFTASEFSGYAVTGVPEPASLTLLALGGLMLTRRRRPGRPSRAGWGQTLISD